MSTREPWQDAAEGEVHEHVLSYVQEVERTQSEIFERFVRLECLYDPHNYLVRRNSHQGPSESIYGLNADVSENVVASNIDTVAAVISATDVRARFMTDDADWSEQRRARHLEWYSEGLAKLLSVPEKCRAAFKDAALKGVGLVKVYPNHELERIEVERVLVDDVIVDEAEVRACRPRQMHHRVITDKATLAAMFPEHERAIEEARGQNATHRLWAGYRQYEDDEVVVIESWSLPIGSQGRAGYKPGRHTIVIDGTDLLDEEWAWEFFPFARMAWTERTTGWYARGLAESLAGHQRALNKLNWQIDRQLDRHAMPTTYVQQADAKLAVKTRNALGTIAVFKNQPPQTVIPPAVSGETYARREAIKASAYEESGLSRLAATSMKPAGLDSGVALREYRDATTQRFAIQEKAYERFYLDAVELLLWAAKQLDDKAPVVGRKTRFGRKKIKWRDVDLGEARIQIAAASTLSRTPAGRMQTVLEWAQAGIVSMDEARRLLQHPDLERAMSLYTAAIEDLERTIEEILDGAVLVPEPYQNLQMGVQRFQMAYLKARNDGAPEEILEALRQWMNQAGFVLSQAAQPQQPAMPPMGAEPAMPGAPPAAPMQPQPPMAA